jgi:hypothetical protein
MSAFDDQVKQTEAPENFTHQDVYSFIESVYSFRIPENKESGEHAFGLLDYYNMEHIGAWLKKQEAELIALREAVGAAKNELKQINHVNVGGREWAHIKAAYKALDGVK